MQKLKGDKGLSNSEASLAAGLWGAFKNGANINAKDRKESTPLHLALIYGWKNIVETLLENGADINAKDIRGQTPLHCSASQDSVEIAEFLIENDFRSTNRPWRITLIIKVIKIEQI